MQMLPPFDQAVWYEINFNELHTEPLRVCYMQCCFHHKNLCLTMYIHAYFINTPVNEGLLSGFQRIWCQFAYTLHLQEM